MNPISILAALRTRLVLWTLLLLPMAAFGTYGLIDLIGTRPLDKGLALAEPAAGPRQATAPQSAQAPGLAGIKPADVDEPIGRNSPFDVPGPYY